MATASASRRPQLDAVGRLAAVAGDPHADLAARPFHREVRFARGQLEAGLGGLGVHVLALGQLVQRLFHDAQALFDLGHAHHVPGHGALLVADGNLVVHPVVHGVGFRPAHVVGDAAAARHRAAGPVAGDHVRRDDAHLFDAAAQDDVFRHQRGVHGQARAHVRDELAHALHEGRACVGVHPAEAERTVRQARAGHHLQQVQQPFAVVEGVHDGGEGPQVQQVRAPPQKVRRDAVQLAGDHPQPFGPLGNLDARQLFHRAHVGPVPGQGVQVVHPAHVGHELGGVLHLGHLLVHAVQVAQHGFRPDDVFAVQFQQHAQYAVGGRVLRPHVQDERFRAGPLLEAAGVAVARDLVVGAAPVRRGGGTGCGALPEGVGAMHCRCPPRWRRPWPWRAWPVCCPRPVPAG